MLDGEALRTFFDSCFRDWKTMGLTLEEDASP